VQAGGRPVRPQPEPEDFAAEEAPRGLMKRMKSLFVAASIVAIAVGGMQIAGGFMHRKPAQTAADNAKAPDHTVAINEDAAAPVPPKAALNPLAPAPTPAAPSSILTDPTPLVPITPKPLAAPALSAPPQPKTQAAKSDITGSIPPAATNSGIAEHLPIEIGGPKLRSAALHGDAAAAYEIGVRFAEGKGVQANAEEAARWYGRAASKGLALAQFRYASLLEKGHGVKKDLAQARRLYLAAAAQGNAKAMHNLAVLYAEGIDGGPDYTTAVQWFRKAAAYGISDSEYNLGVLTARGLGTTKDLAESYKWFALAAEGGDKEAARKRDEVASQLDAATVAAAQRAVKSFVVKPQPHDAVAVAVPPGGWDDAPTPAAHGKAKSGPLALGAYKLGRR
jgi:localization factor PodJL